MTDYIRRLVSGPKARFKDPSLNLELDLVYITPRIIIMGYPADGIESLYRNKRADAKRFLDTRHGKDYWVFNLCPLRENGYEKSVFEGRVTRFPFPDHHAPPLALLPLVTREMHAWLDGSKDRVAVIHCKAGKGRSGTIACSYLLTLATSPPSSTASPPTLSLLSTSDAAESQTQHVLAQVPDDLADEDAVPTAHHYHDRKNQHLDALHKPTDEASDAAVLDPDAPESQKRATEQNDAAHTNPERGFVDALKGVLDLHTARRMRPVEKAKGQDDALRAVEPSDASDLAEKSKKGKQKQGVSIPSQRRCLHYWAMILNGDAPRGVFNIYDVPSGKTTNKSNIDNPLVRITQIRVQMRESGGMKLNLVRAANVVLDKAAEYKNKQKKTNLAELQVQSQAKRDDDASTRDGDGGTFASGPNKLWASVARYDDELVEFLEKWEVRTRSMGPQKLSPGNSPSEPEELKEMDGALGTLFDEKGKWDKGKMVRSFARLGVVGVTKAKGGDHGKKSENMEEGKDVCEYVLGLTIDKRVHRCLSNTQEVGKDTVAPRETAKSSEDVPGIGVETESSTGARDQECSTPCDNSGSLHGGSREDVEISSVSSSAFTSAAHSTSPTPPTQVQVDRAELGKGGLVVEAARELRVKLYVGQVFIGWTWFIPTFHMPQPPSMIPFMSDSPNPARATLHLTRKDLDFPLGLGTAIVDVDIDMEWVVPTAGVSIPVMTTSALKDAAGPVPLGKVTAELHSTSIDSETGRGAGVVQAVNALQGAARGSGTEGEVAEGGVREVVEVRQAKGV